MLQYLLQLRDELKKQGFSQVGVYYNEGPPVPIPNTVVKLFSAENTWRAAARENRSTLTSKASCFRKVLFLLIESRKAACT